MSTSNDLKGRKRSPLFSTIIFILIIILVNFALTAFTASQLRMGDVFLPWQWFTWSNRMYNFDPSFFNMVYLFAGIGMGIPLILYIRFMSRYCYKA